MTTSRLYVDPDYVARAAEDDKFALAFARIESHYFVHGGFFKVCLPPPPPVHQMHRCEQSTLTRARECLV